VPRHVLARRPSTLRSTAAAIVVAVTALSNRLFTEPIDPAADRISSLKDDEEPQAARSWEKAHRGVAAGAHVRVPGTPTRS
jgi:hypothetical protein